MKKTIVLSPAAVLLLMGLGGGTARADEGFVYAWIPNGATPSVSGTYSLNSGSGGAITVQRSGTGSYTVTFPGSNIGTGWVAMAAAYGGVPGVYCTVGGWGGSLISVSCYGSGGVPTDSSFTVQAVSNINDRNIAFAWASQPSTASYTPNSSYSFDPYGGITVTRSGTGVYQVAFAGPGGAGGTAQVNTYAGNAICNSAGWSGSLTVNVSCFDPSGNPVDALYVVEVVPPTVAPSPLGYALADNPTAASYTPAAATAYNSTGQPVRIIRNSTGSYLAIFAAMNAGAVIGGWVHATANQSSAICNVQSWSGGAGSTFQAGVGCWDVHGNAIDTQFEVLALPPSGYAYAWIDDTAGDVSQSYSVNPGGQPVTATHVGTGIYTVTFPGSGIGPGWAAHAIAYGSNASWCKVGSWGGNSVSVLCFNSAGTAVDASFTVLAVSSSNGENIAFAWADQATTASYAANPSYSYNPAGTIAISRASTGSYAVVFHGLNGNGGTVQITAYGTGTATCYANGWETPDFEADVFCINPSGAAVDSLFTVMVIPASTNPFNVAYAWASQPSSASYTATAQYAYNPGGAVAITRSSVGNYLMTFPGLNNTGLAGGNVRATADSSTGPRCNVASWGGAPDVVVSVHCHDRTGAFADGYYEVLVFNPITVPASAITARAGSPQSAVATTAFATALQAVVTDSNGNPLDGVQVTFTAPASGASGAFTGNAATATAFTDSTGTATAPTFTANSIAGPYNVTASFLGATAPATFSLTNTPLTAITLQTAPAGLLVSVDGGGAAEAPLTVSLVPGSTHTIATTSPQAGTGLQNVWQNWSDGLAISHNITVPASTTTYTATFQTQYQLTTAASPPTGGSATPASGGFYVSGTSVPITATASVGFRFTGWTGPVASPSSAATTVTVTAPTSVTATFASSCDVTGDSNATVADVQAMINQALGVAAPSNDWNGDGKVSVVDVQIVLNAAIGNGCRPS